MESNCVQGKIFVGGISAETSEEVLTQHFSRYGEVVKSQVIKYRDTNCGKGFGFVTFADNSLIDQLIHQQHIILGRTVDVKLAIPKGASGQCQLGSECPNFQRQDSNNNRRKIFVGGLPLNLSEEEFKTYFEKFGTISQVNLISDKETKTPRGFGFVTYDSEESVTHALQEKLHWLINKYVEVKKAEPRERRVINSNYHNFYPGYGMWQIYDCNNEIFAPQYCHNHTMVPTNWTSSFNHLGTNQFVHPQPIVPYFTPTYPVNYYGSTHRYPVNCYCSTHNQVDHNRGSYSTFAQNNVINEENDQECNNTEVQLVGDGSLPANESAKSLEKETDNGGEKDDLKKILHDNTKENNDEIDHLVKILQVNSEDDT
ncbi:RNA-binding protein 1-like [Solanum pennellii]|uniref:RNA-binding protein 1-like n=1 Tax=Solanum pennellii TaxID=28526 RepID=A0ABM1G3W8_SOLPN|nr:RNA-binding protein 1-like [Solanum pennellii]